MLLGHRGAANASCPENTLAAVDRALCEGADGVEIDVRLTADGVPVIHHDAGLRRTTGQARQLAGTALADLPTIAGHRIPTLDEMIDTVGARGRLVVEVKTPHWPGGAAYSTVSAVASTLRRHHLHDVVVSSFDRPRLADIRAAIDVRTALLSRPGVHAGVAVRRALADGHDEAHIHVRSLMARPETVGKAVQQGLSIGAWTVDRTQDLQRLRDAGVLAAICDDPYAARLFLQPLMSLDQAV